MDKKDKKQIYEQYDNRLNQLKYQLEQVHKDFSFIINLFENSLSIESQFMGLLEFNNVVTSLDKEDIEEIFHNYLDKLKFDNYDITIKSTNITCKKVDEDNCISFIFELFDEKTIYVLPPIKKNYLEKQTEPKPILKDMFDSYFEYKKEKNLKNFHHYLDCRFINKPRLIQYIMYLTKKVDLDALYEKTMKDMEEHNKKIEENIKNYENSLKLFHKNLKDYEYLIDHFKCMRFDVVIIDNPDNGVIY